MLSHKTSYLKKSLLSRCLPLTYDLLGYDPEGSFHLVDDPLKLKKTSIIGMFVLRPAQKRCTSYNIEDLYGDYDWAYNIRGLDGGRLISNNSTLDAYRLAFQYGMSDAVIIGSNIVCTEGVDTESRRGYLWQPYEVCKWRQLYDVEPNLSAKLYKQRQMWQSMNYLSSRTYPAQIAFTWSGERKDDANDFLAGRVFHDFLPNGERVEAFIMTSQLGAQNIRARAASFGLKDRIEKMLIIVPPPSHVIRNSPSSGPSAELDLSLVPRLLYEQYDMRIANHDGGQAVLLAFARAGALSQLNLTLCMQKSVVDVLQDCDIYDPEIIAASHYDNPVLFEPKIQYFFNNLTPGELDSTNDTNINANTNGKPTVGNFKHSLPKNLEIASVLEDPAGEVAVVTLKTNYKFNFSVE